MLCIVFMRKYAIKAHFGKDSTTRHCWPWNLIIILYDLFMSATLSKFRVLFCSFEGLSKDTKLVCETHSPITARVWRPRRACQSICRQRALLQAALSSRGGLPTELSTVPTGSLPRAMQDLPWGPASYLSEPLTFCHLLLCPPSAHLTHHCGGGKNTFYSWVRMWTQPGSVRGTLAGSHYFMDSRVTAVDSLQKRLWSGGLGGSALNGATQV